MNDQEIKTEQLKRLFSLATLDSTRFTPESVNRMVTPTPYELVKPWPNATTAALNIWTRFGAYGYTDAWKKFHAKWRRNGIDLNNLTLTND